MPLSTFSSSMRGPSWLKFMSRSVLLLERGVESIKHRLASILSNRPDLLTPISNNEKLTIASSEDADQGSVSEVSFVETSHAWLRFKSCTSICRSGIEQRKRSPQRKIIRSPGQGDQRARTTHLASFSNHDQPVPASSLDPYPGTHWSYLVEWP